MPKRDREDPRQPRKLLEIIKRILGFPPFMDLPKDSNAVTTNIWPENYWLEQDVNTFWTIQLNERPVKHKDNAPIKIPPEWKKLIDYINLDLDPAWLFQKGTAGVLAQSDSGSISFPSPQIFGGGNPVKVLGISENGQFARIATLNINNPPPDKFNLQDWMVQNCGFSRDPRRFRSRMLTLFYDNSAWVWADMLKQPFG